MTKISTDFEQSKKLAKILPLDSADMVWNVCVSDNTMRLLPKDDWDTGTDGHRQNIPAWSLSALLNILPFLLIKKYSFGILKGLNKDGETYMIRYNVFNTDITLCKTDYYNDCIDACVEIIEHLKERDLL